MSTVGEKGIAGKGTGLCKGTDTGENMECGALLEAGLIYQTK